MADVVLVTGGAGFIGANLVRRLLALGVRVRVLDNFVKGDRENLSGLRVEVVEGDVRNADAVASALDKDVKHVVHLAAYGSVVDSVMQVLENFEVNVAGTVRLLHLCKERNIEKFVFASSAGAVVGVAEPPITEQSLPKPVSPYGASKLCAEAYCHAFGASYGLKTVCLRFANVYGPYSHLKRSVIPSFISALLENRPMVIYGDGSATRDFLFVEDLCTGICQALSAELEPGTILHLATGRETSILELAHTLRLMARKPDHPIDFQPKRPGELERSFASYDKARDLIGFHPSTSLRKGLEVTFRWFASRMGKASKRSLL